MSTSGTQPSWWGENKRALVAAAAAGAVVAGALLLLTKKKQRARPYRIGTPGKPWGCEEKTAWLQDVDGPKRSYKEDVLNKLEPLRQEFDVVQYGALTCDPKRYPLYAVKSRNWARSKPTVLVTGGVHGYETSGVQGALLFLNTKAKKYADIGFNIVVAPCVSPWGYECIQRWNRNAEDPNRGFYKNSSREECAQLMQFLDTFGDVFVMHLDLHETTDSDSTEFSPALASREGLPYETETIPDGFFIVADSKNPQPQWHKAIIDSVKQVTHIAPADERGTIQDVAITQEGVIAIPAKKLRICAGVTNATFNATTEVYPDSKGMTDDECNRAQCAAITGALDHLLKEEKEAWMRRAREASATPVPLVHQFESDKI